MTRIARCVVLVTALWSLLGAMSATAGAVTWHNSGNSSFTATGGAGTLSVGANNLACTASSATGTAPVGSFVGATYSGVGTITFSPCLLAGQSAYVHCGFTTTGTAFASNVTTGVADVTCDVRLTASPAVKFCHIEGTTPGQYINPSGVNKGRSTVTTSGTGLTVTNGSSPCTLGTGPAHLSEFTITITNASGGTGTGGPVINRTA